MPDPDSNKPKAEGHTASRPSFFSLRRSPKAARIDLEGDDLARARLLDERESRLNTGVGFVFACVLGSFALLTPLFVAFTFNTSWWPRLLFVPVWVGMVLLIWALTAVWLATARRRIARRTRPRPPNQPRMSPRYYLLSMGGLLALYAILILAVSISDRDPGVLLDFSKIILQTSGFGGYVLIYTGLFGVRGRAPRCNSCGYPASDDSANWHTCPECGLDLAAPLAVVLGTRTRRWWLVGLGVIVVWFALLSMVLR